MTSATVKVENKTYDAQVDEFASMVKVSDTDAPLFKYDLLYIETPNMKYRCYIKTIEDDVAVCIILQSGPNRGY